MTFSADLTTLCRAFLSAALQLENQVEMEYVRPLSTAPLQNVVRMLGGNEACWSFLRKYSLCWARFTSPEGFLDRERLSEICTPGT